MSLTEEQVKKFNEDGFLLIENFMAPEVADAVREESHKIVEDMNPEEHNSVFITNESMRKTSDDYFMTSGDKIRFFFEDGAKDSEGKLKVDKQLSLNKIAHALHALNPVFKKVTFDDKVKEITRQLGLVEPVVIQSMVIFKQPGIGGEVIPHQDSTFLHTDPMKLVGFWIALEDATLENGCMHFIPGSHKKGLVNNRRMVRNPDTSEGKPRCIFTGDAQKFNDNDFVAVPVKKGDLVLIHGEVVHKSEKNVSDKSRNIYTFHMIDNNGTKYSEDNWLQPSSTFTPLYTTQAV